MADDDIEQRRRDDDGDERKHRRHHGKKARRDSVLHEALSALKHMPSMNPGGIAPIPDEVKGSTDKPKKSDKG